MEANSITMGEICDVRDGVNPGPREFRDAIIMPLGDARQSWRRLLEGENIEPYRLISPTKVIDYLSERLTPALAKQGASFRQPWIFAPNKIVTRQTANRLIAAFDTSDAVGLNSVHFTRPKKDAHYSAWFVLACLNSRILNSYYQKSFQETRTTFPQVHVSALRLLPIPKVDVAAISDRELIADL
jgi:hypothetical protein